MDNRGQDRLSELFEQAVELPPEARAHFIEVCSDDPAIRSELRSLLAAHDRAPNLLERLAGEVLPAALEAVAEQDAVNDRTGRRAQPLDSTPRVPKGAAMALQSGTRLGPYEIEGRIAAGGIGVVYRALDTTLQRPVAIKILASSSADARESLLREARAASALNHPHICTIYEVGEHDGVPFIAMELVDGQPLRDLIPSEGFAAETVARYGGQVAEAVEHAHNHGIVHRDLKSANVMISAVSQAKVLDFGLASRLPVADMDTLTRTRAAEGNDGPLAGTLPYLAPEVLRGGPANKRSDVWALGVLLYEIASGSLPFLGSSPFDLTAAILEGSPAPLPAKIPMPLRAVIGRCLARDPAQRYQHAGEVRVAVETLQLGTDPSLAVRDESPLVVGRVPWWRRRLVIVGVMALVLAGAVGITLFNAKHASALTDRDTLLVADFVNTTGDSVFDGTLKQALSISLEQSPFLNIVSREEIRDTLRLMTKPPDERVVGDIAREACRRLGAKAMIEGSIAPVGSHYAIGLDALNCESGKTIASEQAEAAGRDQVLKALGAAASSLRRKLGESLPTIQRFDAPLEQATTGSLEALKAFSIGEEIRWRTSEFDAVAFYKRATELDPNFAISYARLSSIYGNLNQSTEWRRNTDEAYARRDRVSERERFYIDGRHCGSDLDCYASVAELWKRTYPRDPMAHGIFADALFFQGNCAKAVEDAAEAVRLSAGKHSQPYGSLARIYLCLGKSTEARRTLDEALARHLEAPIIYLGLFRAGFFEHDDRAMTTVRQWAAGRPEEPMFAELDSEAAAFDGQMRRSRELRLRAEHLSSPRFREQTLTIRARGALYEAAHGDLTRARALIKSTLADSPPASTLPFLMSASLLAGDHETLDSLLRQRARSAGSGARAEWEELVRVLRDVKAGDRGAILRVPAVSPAEVLRNQLFRAYMRGLIYLQAGDAAKAAAEFQRILDHRGASTPSPLYPLAYVQQARAYALSGDQTKARKAYQDFLALWKEADPDIPILREAKAEYARLTLSPESDR